MSLYARIKDHARERRIFQHRILVALVLVVLLMLALLGRLYYLQVVEYQRYATLSESNRVQMEPVAPSRGLIYDRHGRLLADNRPNHNLSLVPERVQDLDATLARLGELVALSAREVDSFHRRLAQRRRPFAPVVLRAEMSPAEIARVAVNFHRLPGVEVNAELVRYYPRGPSLVHALGYVGRMNERELSGVDAENYSATRYIGKLGVEKYYEPLLHGRVGHQWVETNARGRVLRVVEREDPRPGADLQLHLDARLQQAAAKALGEQRGAVVALDPVTGGILALVSKPGYDPNPFVTGISFDAYRSLQESPDLPLFNRALRGQYPPASTLKPIFSLAALDSDTIAPDFRLYDPGWYRIEGKGRRYRDWKEEGHGWVNYMDAIVESCDTFFYELGYRMGIDIMSDYLGRFGFGQVTSLDLPEAVAAIRPSRKWKRRTRGAAWYPGDSLNLAIGQGFMAATPLQLATATQVIANRGQWRQPRMLKEVLTHPDRAPELSDQDVMPPVRLENPGDWDRVIDAMVAVMHGAKGTARASGRGAPWRIAGKTGTAQVFSLAEDEEYEKEEVAARLRDHGLFVGFAPAQDPRIVVAVVVENGGGGSSSAAPVARAVLDAYLADDGEPRTIAARGVR